MNIVDLDLAFFISVFGDVKLGRSPESLLLEFVEDLDSNRQGLLPLFCDSLREAFTKLQQCAIMAFSVVVVWVVGIIRVGTIVNLSFEIAK